MIPSEQRNCALFFVFLLIQVCATARASQRATDAVQLGTTLVAIKYRNGVVVAADSRTSVSGYVSHRMAHKIAPVTDTCVLLRSGSAADTQRIAQEAHLAFLDRKYRYHSQPSISQVSCWIRSAVYDTTDAASLLVAGYDVETQSPKIYSIAPSGSLLEEGTFGVSGSGSTYILGHLDHSVKESSDLDEGEALLICRRAINLAIHRDGSSGGRICVAIIDANGIRQSSFPPEAC